MGVEKNAETSSEELRSRYGTWARLFGEFEAAKNQQEYREVCRKLEEVLDGLTPQKRWEQVEGAALELSSRLALKFFKAAGGEIFELPEDIVWRFWEELPAALSKVIPPRGDLLELREESRKKSDLQLESRETPLAFTQDDDGHVFFVVCRECERIVHPNTTSQMGCPHCEDKEALFLEIPTSLNPMSHTASFPALTAQWTCRNCHSYHMDGHGRMFGCFICCEPRHVDVAAFLAREEVGDV